MESLTREIADCVVDRFAASNLQDAIAGRVVARMQAQIAVEHIERVKAWRVGVNVLGFLFGLFLGLYASRLPAGLTADLLACKHNYNKLDTRYALALEAKQAQLASKQTQLAGCEAKLGVLVIDNQRLMLSSLEKCTWGVNDMLWV